jgi:hypothetical protein
MMSVHEVQMVPIGTIRIEVESGTRERAEISRIHSLHDAGVSSTRDSLPFPLPFPLSSLS